MLLSKPRTIWLRVFLAFLLSASAIYITGSIIKLCLVWHFMVQQGGERSIRMGFMNLVICTAVAFVLTILLSGGLAYVLTHRFARPLDELSRAADDIAQGNWSRRVSSALDVVEFNRLVKAFNTMCDANEERLTELRLLTDDIAHDLRTPLTRLRSCAEFALAGDLSREELAENVCEDCTTMLDMIRTTLDISYASSRLADVPRETVDLAQVARQTVAMMSPIAEAKGLQVDVTLPPHQVGVQGHKTKLQQVLGNLLENAIKFTPSKGRVTLRVDEAPGWVLCEVSDTGPGIPPEALPHIFKRFYRADTSRTLSGNGLGLSLVSAILKAYGGQIKCSSKVGEGTSFRVSFPKPPDGVS